MMSADTGAERTAQPWHRTLWWWAITLLTLVVLDDLTFGPIFWAISRLVAPEWAMVAVYATYVPVQIWLVRRATAKKPGRIADWWMRRLDLERRYPAVRENELRLRSRVTGAGSAVMLSLLIAGVLPPLILHRQGFPTEFVRRLSWLTAAVYATEFALLLGLVPSLV